MVRKHYTRFGKRHVRLGFVQLSLQLDSIIQTVRENHMAGLFIHGTYPITIEHVIIRTSLETKKYF